MQRGRKLQFAIPNEIFHVKGDLSAPLQGYSHKVPSSMLAAGHREVATGVQLYLFPGMRVQEQLNKCAQSSHRNEQK